MESLLFLVRLFFDIIKEIIFVFSGLLMPIVAIFAGYIAYKQFDLGKETYKMTLFEKRYLVFQEVKKLLFRIVQHGSFPNSEYYREFIQKVDSNIFIFKEDINDYMEELKTKAKKINSLTKAIKRHGQKPLDENIRGLLNEQNKLFDWFHFEFETVENRFISYLKL